MRKKIVDIMTFFLVFIMIVLFLQVDSNASEQGPTRQINLVYDDSGSMYENYANQGKEDKWAYAKYSMEVFAAMLGEKDTLNVYYMSDYVYDLKKEPRIIINGNDAAEVNVGKIHDQKTEASETPFNSVRKAYSDLTGSNADEKWLVILTDGAFQGTGSDESDDTEVAQVKKNIEDFLSQKSDDIKVTYLSMGSDAIKISSAEDKNIFVENASDSTDILNKITGISTRVFNSNRLDVNGEKKSFSFDIPMNELIVFAQGSNVEIKGIKNSENTLISPTEKIVEVKYSDCDASNYDNSPVTDLKGVIAYFNEDFQAGDYSLDIEGAQTIEIFYKPNVDVAAYLTDSEGKEVTDMSDLEQGEYTISFGFVKSGTKEKVGNSQLLGNVRYEAGVTNNGKTHENLYTDGDKISLEEGALAIDATAYYLDYNRVSSHLDYSVFKNKEVTFNTISSPVFNVTSTGIEANDYIEIEAKLDGHEIGEEQWEKMEVPSVRMKDEPRSFKLSDPTIEKTDKAGIFRISPALEGERPSAGTYTDTTYEIKYEQTIGSETWSGSGEDTLHLTDSRSWFERNRDLLVKLFVLAGIIAFFIGYLPFIKRYLPKSLQRYPKITFNPGRGKRRGKTDTRYNGLTTKGILTTILPYCAQTAKIRFAPEGVAANLLVKAAKGRRMKIVNEENFIDDKNILFGGQMLAPRQKDYIIPAGINITTNYPRIGGTYICNLNQKW